MWSQWIVILALVLFQNSNAELMSPSDPVCPGNRVVFICQQSAFAQWMIILPSVTLQNTVYSPQAGSVLAFVNDPGYNFELHVVSFNSNTLTTELRVNAVRQLNGTTVECTGSEAFMTIIQVASVDPPAAPSGVMATNKQFTKTGASVNVSWSTSRGADNYTVNVTPPIMPGQLSDFTTTDTSLLLMLLYNVNYTINITAQNCAGSDSAILPLTIAGCSPPSSPTNGRINEYHDGSVGASLTFQCNTGYLPHEQVTSTCTKNGSWVPIPRCVMAANVKKVLSTSSQLILTAVICSFVFLFFGVLIGVLCHRWGRVFIKPCTGDIKHSNRKRREHPSPTDTPAGDGPVVYEEVTTDSHSRQKIELEENVAYGHI